ncbi:MAG: DUF1501 domain-containing protein [Isosphaerales bacterium]
MDQSRTGHRHAIGLTRRELLQVGYSGLLGIGLPSLWTGEAAATATASGRKAKSVLLIFLTGAPSHLDTFDLKPEAPVEIRGDFKTIATRAPGVRFCEHLPGLAARADKLAVIRSMTHGLPSHEHATHMMLTGVDVLPPGSTHMASRADWPCYASGLDFVQPRRDGIPSGINLPTYLNNGYGFSGQNAGVLGPKFDPWHIRQDPNEPAFRVEDLSLPVGLTAAKIGRRRALLAEIDGQSSAIDRLGSGRAFAGIQDRAFTMLTSGRVKRAFEIEREDPRLRDRYGRHMFGQSLLLSRRLIQAGVPIVQANMGHMNNWDTHTDNCTQLRTRLLPPLDQGVSALLDDLEAHGLLAETLVVMVGEFGRTPKIGQSSVNDPAQRTGRDHWAGVFSAVFAGGGVRGGQVIGRSDRIGAYPATRGYYPSDLGATIYHALGVDPASEVRDQLGRPLHLNRGEVISPLFDGTSA